MKILFITLGSNIIASSRTRVYQFIPHIEKHNISTKIIPIEPTFFRHLINLQYQLSGVALKVYKRIFPSIKKFTLTTIRAQRIAEAIKLAPQYDMVYLQKAILQPEELQALRSATSKLVYDFDDAIFLTHKDQVNEQITKSDLVIVSSPMLQEYVTTLGKDAMVLSTPIDIDRYRPIARPIDEHKSPIVIGWIGIYGNTYYLNTIDHAIKRIQERYGERVQFFFVGADTREISNDKVKVQPWSMRTELEHLHSFDIGIMPLPEIDEWAKHKAGYKLLQYMAVAIPCIASPIGINSSMITHERNGFLAINDNEWVSDLVRLIESAELRQRMGLEGRKIAEQNYSHQHLVNQLISILQK